VLAGAIAIGTAAGTTALGREAVAVPLVVRATVPDPPTG